MATLHTADGASLNLFDWSVAEPRLTVALLHGYGEHAGRYAHVAKALNDRGIGVVAADLRGHGKSSGARGHVLDFHEYHHDATAIVNAARERAKGRPVGILSHSMGGLLAFDWLLSGGGKDLCGVVVSSPFLGLALAVNPVKAALGRVMSKVLPSLALASGLKGIHVTRDAEHQKLYDSDPLNNKKATARWFTEALRATERVHARAGEIQVPLLLLYAGEDRVASADATDRFARALKSKQVTFERLAGHYHELMNEPEDVRRVVIDRIATWLIGQAEAKAA